MEPDGSSKRTQPATVRFLRRRLALACTLIPPVPLPLLLDMTCTHWVCGTQHRVAMYILCRHSGHSYFPRGRLPIFGIGPLGPVASPSMVSRSTGRPGVVDLFLQDASPSGWCPPALSGLVAGRFGGTWEPAMALARGGEGELRAGVLSGSRTPTEFFLPMHCTTIPCCDGSLLSCSFLPSLPLLRTPSLASSMASLSMPPSMMMMHI